MRFVRCFPPEKNTNCNRKKNTIFAEKMRTLKSASLFVLVSLLFSTTELVAQELSAKWSETIELNSKELFFNEIIGESSANLYLLYTDKFYVSTEPAEKAKLVAFDRNSLSNVSTLYLKGYSENKKEHNDLDFHTCVVKNDRVLIFWSKNTPTSEELYLEVFDENLKQAVPLRKIYVNEHAYDLKRTILAKEKSSIVVSFNEKRNEDLLIGGEIPVSNDYVRFEYALLNDDWAVSPLQTVALPVQMRDKSYAMCSTYEYLENGDVLIRNAYTGEAGKGVTKNIGEGGILLSNMNPYHTISYLKIETNKISTIELPVTKMSFNTASLKSVIIDDELRTYGLYYTDKGKLAGLFCGKFTIENLSATEEYITFDQPTLDSLGNNNLLKDVLVKNNNLVIFIASYYPTTVGPTLTGVRILGYDLNHELQWSNKTLTIDNPSSFNVLAGSDEVLVFFGKNKRDESKKIQRILFGVNIIGYSRINVTTGELIEKQEIELDRQVSLYLMKLLEHRLCVTQLDRSMNGEIKSGSLGVISFE